MMRRILCAGTALLLPTMAQAADMSLATFLQKADALEAKGILAMGSPDLALLKGEMQRVGQSYRADINAAKAAKRAPHSCPPPKITMSSDEVMKELRKVPVAQRQSTTVRAAFYGVMKRRYPCA